MSVEFHLLRFQLSLESAVRKQKVSSRPIWANVCTGRNFSEGSQFTKQHWNLQTCEEIQCQFHCHVLNGMNKQRIVSELLLIRYAAYIKNLSWLIHFIHTFVNNKFLRAVRLTQGCTLSLCWSAIRRSVTAWLVSKIRAPVTQWRSAVSRKEGDVDACLCTWNLSRTVCTVSGVTKSFWDCLYRQRRS